MDNIFLDIQGLGKLQIKQTLVAYDDPLIFVCEDDSGCLYLFNEIDETEDWLKWQAIQIAEQTYQDILSSQIPLCQVFKEKQTTPFLLISHSFESGETTLDSSFTLHCPEILKGKDTFLRDFSA